MQKEQTQQQHEPAIHRINLSSIKHNYNCVQTSAARQQCQVIVVVKADAYGRKRAMPLTSLQYCTYYLIIKLACYLTYCFARLWISNLVHMPVFRWCR